MKTLKPKDLLQGKAPAFLVSNLVNIRYLTGLQLTSGLLLVTPQKFILFVDDRYREMARRKLKNNFLVLDFSLLKRFISKYKKCGFEEDDISMKRFYAWKTQFKNTKLIRFSGLIEEIRRKKNDKEIRLLHHAESMTEEMLSRIPRALKRFPTEVQLARMLETWAKDLGADGLSFDPIVAFGTHTSRPHHRPTDRRLKEGHIVQIDVGARYRGYCADRSEVFFTSRPTKKQAYVFHALREAKDEAKALAKAGITNHALDHLARTILKSYKLNKYFIHSLGHGVGLDIHEGINISYKAPEQKLLSGEVITIEPGVYFPGNFGMRLEDMVFIL